MKTDQLSCGIFLSINQFLLPNQLKMLEVQVALLLKMIIQLLQDGEMVLSDAMKQQEE